jgi:hypothetical protein
MNTNNSSLRSLETVQQAFARWRQIRPHKRSRIPQKLLEQAAAACEAERPTRVARQLGISYAVLKKQLESKTSDNKETIINSTKQEFIKVDLKQTIPPALTIEVERNKQEVIRFTFSGIGSSQINEIIKLFL